MALARTQAENGAQDESYGLSAWLRCVVCYGLRPSRRSIPMDSSTKPTVKWVLLPMAGLKGEGAAASQTSRSGLDMCGEGRNGGSESKSLYCHCSVSMKCTALLASLQRA